METTMKRLATLAAALVLTMPLGLTAENDEIPQSVGKTDAGKYKEKHVHQSTHLLGNLSLSGIDEGSEDLYGG